MMNRTKRTILSGDDETEVYELEASKSGPTAVVVAGIHGNEVTGWEAANLVKLWNIDRGKIVVIPQANKQACLNRTRNAPGESDLNRQFPSGQSPTTPKARGIWNEIGSHDPDFVFDLHRSIGLSGGRSPSGVGQTIFPTPNARDAAESALSHVNNDHVPSEFQATHYFRVGNDQSGRNPLLSHKVGGDMPNAKGWLLETTTYRQSPELQREQLEHLVETLLYHGGDRIRVTDYGHHEQEPNKDILDEYNESDDCLYLNQRTAQDIVDLIRDEYNLD